MDNHIPRVLLVDDDLNLLKSMSEILKAKGFEAILAQTGGAALTQIEQQPIDVALIDLKLDDMSGLDVLRSIKTRAPDCECILLTGNATQASAIEAIQMGVFGYFQKPFEVKQVLLSIQRAADKNQSALALRESEEKYRRLFDRASLGIFQSTPQGQAISVNPAFARMFGYDSIEDALQSIKDVSIDIFVDPNRRAEIIRMLEANPGLKSFENLYRRKDGSSFIGNLNTMPVLNSDGRLIRIEGVIEDITERKQAEEALRNSEMKAQKNITLLRSIMESPHGVVIFALAGNFCYSAFTVTHKNIMKVIWGVEIEIGMNILDVISAPLDREKARENFERAMRGEQFILIEEYGDTAKYRTYYENRYSPISDEIGVISGVTVFVTDITERKRAEEALGESEEKYRQLVELSPDLIVIHSDGKICFANQAGLRLVGADALNQMLGKPTLDFVAPNLRVRIAERIQQAFLNGDVLLPLDEKFVRLDGREVDVSVTAVPTTWQGKAAMQVIARDITERKIAEEELRRTKEELETLNHELKTALAREHKLAHTDALTGINNRRHLFELAEHKIAIASRYQQPLAVMMIDIDHFKHINDTFGHAIGDQMLKHVTQIACAKLRSADVIGRYGGEEFVILLPMTNAQQALPLAERIRAGVANLRVSTPKGDASVTLSIGIAEMEHGTRSETVEDIFRRADKTMYAAKQAGRNRVVICGPE
jgi:diguanylate cyclase (GGDEF)-like protein/PAS domain S-box-containing protein